MTPYLVVALGSALGGLLRYSIARLTLNYDASMPWSTILINVLGSFVISFFGTLTLSGSRYEVSPNLRLFVMIGLCGGFTTFSSFSLETFELARSGALGRALLNIGLSLFLCLAAVAVGHRLGQRANPAYAITQSNEEKFSG